MGVQAPEELLAIHTSVPGAVPLTSTRLRWRHYAISGLGWEQRAYEQLLRTYKQVEYAQYMAARPQTLYGIADSPVGLAAWLIDHNDADSRPSRRSSRLWSGPQATRGN